ncbi:MAG: hypothetical protein ACREBW_02605, partial [Candidatus Micrarchaeaceae archaeon]
MFIERRINSSSGVVELWRCQWEYPDSKRAKKAYLGKICDERPNALKIENVPSAKAAICWAYGRTLGNIAVFSQALLGHFPEKAGNNAILPCDFVHAGKFRHGVDRLWCRTHQTHWGTKADLESFDQIGEMRCANHAQPMNYVVSPLVVNVNDYAEVGIWCSMPAALSTEEVKRRPPKIHVHVREKADGQKIIDRDFDAISTLYSTNLGIFRNQDITRVNITPPAAFDFVCALEARRGMNCINCSTCGYPHLDLGDFAKTPHRKHFCGNCGRDSTWSQTPIVSTPLMPLHDTFAKNLKYETPHRSLNLDEYPGCSYTVWASTPAILWTAERPQEFGIHVHVHRGTTRVIDNTF